MSPPGPLPVPQVSLAGLSGAPVLRGFSGQEWWGRWTLGREAAVEFSLLAPQSAVIEYTGYLGQTDQRISVWLDGRRIGSFAYNNGGGDKAFGQATAAELGPGPHTLRFESSRSSRSEGRVNPAPGDLRDLGIAFYRLQVRPRPAERPELALPADLLRDPAVLRLGQFVFQTPGPYLPVSHGGLTLEFHVSQEALAGRPALDFGLLRQREGQGFTFSLDGQPFFQTPRQPGAGLVGGTVPLPPAAPGLHRLRIEAHGTGAARDTSYLLTEASVRTGQVSFYAEHLLLRPSGQVQPHLPWAVAGAVLLLLCLSHLLFGRGREGRRNP